MDRYLTESEARSIPRTSAHVGRFWFSNLYNQNLLVFKDPHALTGKVALVLPDVAFIFNNTVEMVVELCQMFPHLDKNE